MSSAERRSARLSQVAFKLARKSTDSIESSSKNISSKSLNVKGKSVRQKINNRVKKSSSRIRNNRKPKVVREKITKSTNILTTSNRRVTRSLVNSRISAKRPLPTTATHRQLTSSTNEIAEQDDSILSNVESEPDSESNSSNAAQLPGQTNELNRPLSDVITPSTSSSSLETTTTNRHHQHSHIHHHHQNSTSNQPNFIQMPYQLPRQLRKETSKFEKACRQLANLDQHIHDLHNSFSSSIECDRKTFKILYRMQLATYEGTRNAYIEYIERQMEKIKRLRRYLLDTSTATTINTTNSSSSSLNISTGAHQQGDS